MLAFVYDISSNRSSLDHRLDRSRGQQVSVYRFQSIRQNRLALERQLAVVLLRATLDQTDPKLQNLLVEKLGSGPLGEQVASSIDLLSQLGLSVPEPQETQQGISQMPLQLIQPHTDSGSS